MAGLGIFEKQYIWISVIKTQIHEKGTNTIRTEALHLFLSSATRSDAAPTASPFAHGSVTLQTQKLTQHGPSAAGSEHRRRTLTWPELQLALHPASTGHLCRQISVPFGTIWPQPASPPLEMPDCGCKPRGHTPRSAAPSPVPPRSRS